jgi:hypothetical protein
MDSRSVVDGGDDAVQTVITLGERCTFQVTDGVNKRMQRILRITRTVVWEMWRSRDWELAAEEFFLDLATSLRRRRFLDAVTLSPEVRERIIKKRLAKARTSAGQLNRRGSRGRAPSQLATGPRAKPSSRAVAAPSALLGSRAVSTSSLYSVSSGSPGPSRMMSSLEFNPFSGTLFTIMTPCFCVRVLLTRVGAQSHWRTSAWPMITRR